MLRHPRPAGRDKIDDVQTMAGAEPLHTEGHGANADVGVLLVHGITATPQLVRPTAEHLARQGYAVSAPLLPGHGTTWQLMGRTRYDDWATTVEAEAADLASGRRGPIRPGRSTPWPRTRPPGP